MCCGGWRGCSDVRATKWGKAGKHPCCSLIDRKQTNRSLIHNWEVEPQRNDKWRATGMMDKTTTIIKQNNPVDSYECVWVNLLFNFLVYATNPCYCHYFFFFFLCYSSLFTAFSPISLLTPASSVSWSPPLFILSLVLFICECKASANHGYHHGYPPPPSPKQNSLHHTHRQTDKHIL